MAKKRQTVVGKWNDRWFCKLTPQAKLIWLYLCDNCDHVGMWEYNEELMRFQIKFTASVSIEKHLKEMDDVAQEMGIEKRIEWVQGTKILWVVNFVKVQNGELGSTSSIHVTILREFARYKGIAAPDSVLGKFLQSLDEMICRVQIGYNYPNKKKKIEDELLIIPKEESEEKIPLKEVIANFESRGGTKKMAEHFHAKHEAAGWVDGYGRPLKNYLPLVGLYIANWTENDQKKKTGHGRKGNSGTGKELEFDKA